MNRSFAALCDIRHDNAVLQRLTSLARLSPTEADAVRDLSQSARHYPAQSELGAEGRVQAPLVLMAGWACRQRILGDGRRQIVRFLLPGDTVGSLARPGLPASPMRWR